MTDLTKPFSHEISSRIFAILKYDMKVNSVTKLCVHRVILGAKVKFPSALLHLVSYCPDITLYNKVKSQAHNI